MNRLPYLLPWVRVLLLIRSITSTTWGHEAWSGGEAGAPPRIGAAPADRTGGMVELDSRGFLVKDHEPAIEQLRHVRR